MSPSSAEAKFTGEVDAGSSRKAQKTMHGVRTHCSIAGLLKMRSVDPHTIAYIACQVSAFLYQTYFVDFMILQYLSYSFTLHYLAPCLGIYKMKSSTTICFTATLSITLNNLRHARSPMISKTCSSGGTGKSFCIGFFWVWILNFMSAKFSAAAMHPLTCHSRWRFSRLLLQDSKWLCCPSTQG